MTRGRSAIVRSAGTKYGVLRRKNAGWKDTTQRKRGGFYHDFSHKKTQ